MCFLLACLRFVEDPVQSEKEVEEFTSGGSEQLLHLWGGTIHEPSIPVLSTTVNTCVKIGACGVSLQWPAVSNESSHGIAVDTI